jgi:signal transduction histidine kinase
MARSHRPDLILLDVSMPGMNGYQVCEAVKNDPDLKDIPVLFLSGKSETKDILRGFQAGGSDYISKPFQLEEVESRVRVHLELAFKHKELTRACRRLQEAEQVRDNLFHMIVHDLRSPLNVVLGSLGVVQNRIPKPAPELDRPLKIAQAAVQRLSEMTSQLLDIHRFEEKQMPLQPAEGDLVQTAREAIAEAGYFCGSPLHLEAPERLPAVYDGQIVRRVLENLLGNACKFSPDSREVRVSMTRRDGTARIAVTDHGPGIPEQYHARIFEKFGQVDRRGHGSGLGLTFCKLAVEAHGGSIGLESVSGKGSSFWFSLPLEQQSS